ncbi:polysaccharide deacetylase family protein, partial [Streptomyces albogriseolus]
AATPPTDRASTDANLRGRGTVLMHDRDPPAAPGCWRATLDALPDLVAGWRAAGLTVGPLAEHGTAVVRATAPRIPGGPPVVPRRPPVPGRSRHA